jgi:hypothetical protein
MQASLLVGTLFLAGCAPHFVVITPLGERPTGRPAVTVGEIGDALPPEIPVSDHPQPEVLGKLRTILRDDLEKVGAKMQSEGWGGTDAAKAKKGSGLFSSVVIASTDSIADGLLLTGKILSYRHGSRAARYFIGFGAGKSELVAQLTLRAAGHSEDLFVGNFRGQIKGGLFGGSNDEALHEVSRQFTKMLKDKWR